MKTMKRLTMALSVLLALACMVGAADLGVYSYKETIKPQYDDTNGLGDGLVAVCKNGKWGYVDKDNKVVIPFTYDYGCTFNEGLAVVGTLQKNAYGSEEYVYGCIDRDNNYTPFMRPDDKDPSVIVPVTESKSGISNHYFHNGFVTTIFGSAIKTDGVAMTLYGESPFNEGYFVITDYDKDYTGLLDRDGNLVKNFGPAYSYQAPLAVNQGMILLKEYDWDKGHATDYGFWDVAANKWVTDPIYTNYYYSGVNTQCQVFNEGLACVEKHVPAPYGQLKAGAIDKTGKVVVPFKFEELWPYHEGLAVAKLNGLYGYVNQVGAMVIPTQYSDATPFQGGIAVVIKDGEGFLIDTNGNPIPGTESIDTSAYFTENEFGEKGIINPSSFVTVEKNGKIGFGEVDYLPALPETKEMSPWAYKEVTGAIKEKLVPASLQCLYGANMTRNEFADLVMCAMCEIKDSSIRELVEEATGESLYTYIQKYPFNDSSSYSVIAANALGIINGDGKGHFLPNDQITREEAAAFLTRAATALGADTTQAAQTTVADKSTIAPWFVEYISYMNTTGIMTTTGGNKFSPQENYTREQSYITIYRLFQTITQD